jgi:hypothetical protein
VRGRQPPATALGGRCPFGGRQPSRQRSGGGCRGEGLHRCDGEATRRRGEVDGAAPYGRTVPGLYGAATATCPPSIPATRRPLRRGCRQRVGGRGEGAAQRGEGGAGDSRGRVHSPLLPPASEGAEGGREPLQPSRPEGRKGCRRPSMVGLPLEGTHRRPLALAPSRPACGGVFSKPWGAGRPGPPWPASLPSPPRGAPGCELVGRSAHSHRPGPDRIEPPPTHRTGPIGYKGRVTHTLW